MARADIRLDGSPGPLDGATLLTPITITNNGDATETEFVWFLYDQPPGSTASLVYVSDDERTLTPDVEGTYVVGLVVAGPEGLNGLGADNDIQQISVPFVASGLRFPATIDRDGTDELGRFFGHRDAFRELWEYVDTLATGGTINRPEELSRIFPCTVAESVGDVVAFNSGGVRRAVNTDPALMPAIGVIVEKPTTTTARVTMVGFIDDYPTSTTFNQEVWVGASPGVLTSTPPGAGSIRQFVGTEYGGNGLQVSPGLQVDLR